MSVHDDNLRRTQFALHVQYNRYDSNGDPVGDPANDFWERWDNEAEANLSASLHIEKGATLCQLYERKSWLGNS